MSIENLSEQEIRQLEAMKKLQTNRIDPVYQHYGSHESLSEQDTRQREAMIKTEASKIEPSYQHYGSRESLSEQETSQFEGMKKLQTNRIDPVYQHYGSHENLNENDSRILQAQVMEQRKQDIPHKDYLNNLLENPTISDKQQFENSVVRSMESNGLMRNFTSNLVEKISEATYAFKRIPKDHKTAIEQQKQKLESLVNVYIRYLYELKKHDWTFQGPGNNIGLEMISSEMLEDIWQVQKEFNITFNMPIPKNLGQNYGQAFERQGKMVPAITLMYDDLKNKEVNWHQVLIYEENELTPHQRYIERQEETIKQFDLARQEELKATLTKAHQQEQEDINEMFDSITKQVNLDTSTIRR